MNNIQLYNNDCLIKLKELEENSIDSIVTDPPYEISFMSKGWDGTGIAFNTEVWKECLRVLKPGGHILAFGATRTYHRMTVAIEDAGFEIRDCLFWCYGSGFPKSHNIGKAVDKIGGSSIGWFGEWLKKWREENNIPQSKVAKLFPSKTGGLTGCVSNWELGKNIPTLEEYNKIVEEFHLPFKSLEELEREVIGKKNSACFGKEERHTIGSSTSVEVEITKGNSPYEGFGTALKPAVEPVVMGRKPFKGNVAGNVLEWGTGGLNIDDCRIGTEGGTKKSDIEKVGDVATNFTIGKQNIKNKVESLNEGRWPANLILDEEAGKLLDEQSGYTKSTDTKGNKVNNGWQTSFVGGKNINPIERIGYSDMGGASRFFYCPKVNKKERNEGLDVVEQKNNRPVGVAFTKDDNLFEQKVNNFHPTVKPVALLSYLIRLVTPKGGTVLDPFMGSGSTGKAAIKEGMDFVGIEKEEEYFKIAQSRIEHEAGQHKYREFF